MDIITIGIDLAKSVFQLQSDSTTMPQPTHLKSQSGAFGLTVPCCLSVIK